MRYLVMLMMGITSLALGTDRPPAFHSPCEIRATQFEGWAAQKISNEWLELMIVPQLGGRLMQASFIGHPYLYVNRKYKGQYIPPSEANGKWFNYGGDKLWPLPEGHGDGQWPGPVSDALDDGEYQLSALSEGEACAVRLDGPPEMRTGLRYSREIRIARTSPEISFRSTMTNVLDRPIRWSVQSVTQYEAADSEKPDQYNRDFWAMTPLNPQSTYLNGYHVRSGLADDPSFSTDGGMFTLHWLSLENEVWLDARAGWIVVEDVATHHAMVERFRYVDGGDYPGKASVIFYKNGASVALDDAGQPILRSSNPNEAHYYMEAELNSPIIRLAPGESYTMETSWLPLSVPGRVTDVVSAGAIVAPLTAAVQPGSVLISGSFGVFFPGRLSARFLDAGGQQLEAMDVGSVVPQTPVNLRQQLKCPEKARQLSLHLIDDQGRERGSLGEASLSAERKEL